MLPIFCKAQAQEIKIEIKVKPELVVGDNLEFNYSIISNINQQIKFLPKIKCPDAPQPSLEIKEVYLKAGEKYSDKYFSLGISDLIEPQECTVSINIIEPIQQQEEKIVRIITDPSFNVEVLLCKEEKCINRSKVYRMGDKVYVSIKSDATKFTFTAKLVDPEKNEKTISSPDNFTLDKKGEYNLTLTIKADGYKDNIQIIPITVLESDVQFNDLRVCKVDNNCLSPENIQNCPQDCLAKRNIFSSKTNLLIIVGGLSLLVVLLIAAIIFYIKKRNKDNSGIKYSNPDDKQ